MRRDAGGNWDARSQISEPPREGAKKFAQEKALKEDNELGTQSNKTDARQRELMRGVQAARPWKLRNAGTDDGGLGGVIDVEQCLYLAGGAIICRLRSVSSLEV